EDARVRDPAHAGMEAGGGLPGLDPGVAEDALLRFPAFPVVIDLLVGAAGDAHPPRTALLLAHENDPVLAPLVDGAGGTGGEAGRVQAVVADPGEVEAEDPLQREHPGALLLGEVRERGVPRALDVRSHQVVVPD